MLHQQLIFLVSKIPATILLKLSTVKFSTKLIFEQLHFFLKFFPLLHYFLLKYIVKWVYHCVKSVCIRSYSCPYFPVFGLNTDTYAVSLSIHFEWGKIQTRITPNTDTFHAVYDTQIPLSTSVTFSTTSGNKTTEGLVPFPFWMTLFS